MSITLLEALPLRNAISRRIHELLQERDRVAFVEFEKGEEYDKPSRTWSQITDELNEVRNDFRALDVAVALGNLTAALTWDGKEISITEAIELAKQLRGEASKLKHYGTCNKQERKQSYGEVKTIYRLAMFDPSSLQKEGMKLERLANRLSLEIEKANHVHTIAFDSADKYL